MARAFIALALALKMPRVRTIGPALALLVLSQSASAQQGVRHDGTWQIEMQTDMGGRNIPTTLRQCVTKEQAADPMNRLPGGPEARRGCRMSNYKVAGRTVTWTVTCDGPPAATTKGVYTYSPDAYVGLMTMVRAGQTITTRLTGKRLGDCPLPPAAGGRSGRGAR